MQLGHKSFLCTLCNKTFDRRDSVTRHVQTHSTQKPFVCTYCPYAGTNRGYLYKHIKKHHNETFFKSL